MVRSHMSVFAAGVVMALISAACGDDSSTSGPAPAAPAAPAGTEATAPVPEPTGADESAGPSDSDPEISSTGPADRGHPDWAATAISAEGEPVAVWSVEVVSTRPHDEGAFTQGLEIHEGRLLESTGLFGESTIRWVDPDSGRVLERIDLPGDMFGEGATVVDDRVVQLTFRSGVAFVRDIVTLEVLEEVGYEGEGWGICHDGTRLVTSDGTATLRFRDPVSFEVDRSVVVTRAGEPVDRLNELECADGYVLANVWKTDTILVIDPETGRAGAEMDASNLRRRASTEVSDDEQAVLNGVAQLDGPTFLLTGKLWPVMYEVRFVEA